MTKQKILIIAASNGKNLELAEQVQTRLEAKGEDSEILDLVSLKLSLYSPDEEKKGAPKKVGALIETLEKTDAFVFISPEYNGCIPPVLNNFIAWVSVSSKDFRACFGGKSAAMMSFSGTGSTILPVMRMQLAYMGFNVVGRQLLANYHKPAKNESIDAVLDELIKISKRA